MGADHRVLRLEVPEQPEHHHEVGGHAQCRQGFDAQVAVESERLHGLLAADGWAGEDSPDGVVLKTDQQPGRLGLPCH
jgi:hypothetical protein